ncbi:dienelactone hydrolase family protein [uncultured Draconibacterium sp.]|uniref:alpha/beta hydrolase n=1 Tax=uncultured Draconibacterium sp. TaxID=1573823 RepID=UPI003216DC04
MNLTIKSDIRKTIVGFSILFFALAFSNLALAQVEEEALYPEGITDNPIHFSSVESYVDSMVSSASLSGQNRVYSYVSEPTISIYPANEQQNKHIGLIIAPGGGLRNVWLDKEGTDIALYLSKMGISCMVLKYRVNHRLDNGKWQLDFGMYVSEAEKDAKQAVKLMRSFSDKYNFDEDKVGMIGFSAGGWLTERITVKKMGKYGAEKPQWMPDFAGFIYHGSSPKNAKNVDEINHLPPLFMAIARDDEKLPVDEIIPYLTAIVLNVEKSELHVYNKGKHGFGLAYENGNSVADWKDSFFNWMMDLYPDNN